MIALNLGKLSIFNNLDVKTFRSSQIWSFKDPVFLILVKINRSYVEVKTGLFCRTPYFESITLFV
jgi:hypothetical protein